MPWCCPLNKREAKLLKGTLSAWLHPYTNLLSSDVKLRQFGIFLPMILGCRSPLFREGKFMKKHNHERLFEGSLKGPSGCIFFHPGCKIPVSVIKLFCIFSSFFKVIINKSYGTTATEEQKNVKPLARLRTTFWWLCPFMESTEAVREDLLPMK